MFNKLTRKHIAHGLGKAKNFIGTAYNHTKNFVGNVDHGVRVLKQVDGALSPVLDQYGASNNVHGNVMKAISSYDNIRHQVVDAHTRANDNVNQVKNNLAKTRISFDFS